MSSTAVGANPAVWAQVPICHSAVANQAPVIWTDGSPIPVGAATAPGWTLDFFESLVMPAVVSCSIHEAVHRCVPSCALHMQVGAWPGSVHQAFVARN